MKNLILVLVMTSCLLACQKKPTVDNISLSYNKVESFMISLQNKDQYNHSQIQLMDSCSIIALDRNFQKLDIFSLCESTFKSSIPFSNDGPNRVYPVSSFYYHSVDSIFLFSLDALTFQLIDSLANVIDEWRMGDNLFPQEISDTINGGTGYFYPFSLTQNGMFNLPFVYDDSKQRLIFNIVSQSEFMGLHDLKTFYSSPTIGNYNLANRSFSLFEGKWPELYRQDKTPNNPFNSLVFNHDKGYSIINFLNSDMLYSTRDSKFHGVRSNYFKGRHTLFSISGSNDYTTEEELEAYHNDEGYANLVYDRYKKLYYRIAKHSNKNLENASSHRLEASWSIIVFNKEFEVLGEVLMPKAVYNYLQILPTPKGLLISKENPYSPTNKEEEYAFDLIEINL